MEVTLTGCAHKLHKGGMCLHQEEQMSSWEGAQASVIYLPGSQTCMKMGILEIQTWFKPNGEQIFFQTKEARNGPASKLKWWVCITAIKTCIKGHFETLHGFTPLFQCWLPQLPVPMLTHCQGHMLHKTLQNRTAAQGTPAAITQTQSLLLSNSKFLQNNLTRKSSSLCMAALIS